MNKLMINMGVLFFCGIVSVSAQVQFTENNACQDDPSMAPPKFTETISPLDTLKNIS